MFCSFCLQFNTRASLASREKCRINQRVRQVNVSWKERDLNPPLDVRSWSSGWIWFRSNPNYRDGCCCLSKLTRICKTNSDSFEICLQSFAFSNLFIVIQQWRTDLLQASCSKNKLNSNWNRYLMFVDIHLQNHELVPKCVLNEKSSQVSFWTNWSRI